MEVEQRVNTDAGSEATTGVGGDVRAFGNWRAYVSTEIQTLDTRQREVLVQALSLHVAEIVEDPLQDGCLHVCDFEGDDYNDFVAQDLAIVGVLAVLQSLPESVSEELGVDVDVRQDRWKYADDQSWRGQLYSRTLEGLAVCPSGFHEGQKRPLEFYVCGMGGEFHRVFTHFVTHLVTTGSPTHKFSLAIEHGMELVTPDWVQACWNSHRLPDTFPFRPVFGGIRLSVTQINDKEWRAELKQMVEQRAGTYEPNFSPNSTHLVAAKREGGKYEAALRWGVPVVTEAWVVDSCRIGVLLDERDYALGSSGASSTGRRKTNEILDGCVVYVHEEATENSVESVDEERANKLQRELRLMGATRRRKYGNDVTHVLVTSNDDVSTLRDSLDQFDGTPFVLRDTWALQCHKYRRRLHMRPFDLRVQLEALVELRRQRKAWRREQKEQGKGKAKGKKSGKGKENIGGVKAAAVRRVQKSASISGVNDPILSAYASSESGTTTTTTTTTTSSQAPPAVQELLADADAKPIFAGRKMLLLDPICKHNKVLKQVLRQRGAKVVRNAAKANVVVLPHQDSLQAHEDVWKEVRERYERDAVWCVTADWLAHSLAHGRLPALNESPIFTPVPHAFPITDMRGVRMCGIGLDAETTMIVKDAGMMATEDAQAYVEQLDVQECTHAICGVKEEAELSEEERTRVQVCVQHGVAVVSIQWLFDCVRRGERLDTDGYEMYTHTSNKRSVSQSAFRPALEVESVLDALGGEYAFDERKDRKRKAEALGVLDGACVCVWKNLRGRNEAEATAEALGARVEEKVLSGITHFVYAEGGSSSSGGGSLREALRKVGRLPGRVHMVAPEWLDACQREQRWMPESEYPPGYNMRMVLDVLSESSHGLGGSSRGQDDDQEDGGDDEMAVLIREDVGQRRNDTRRMSTVSAMSTTSSSSSSSSTSSSSSSRASVSRVTGVPPRPSSSSRSKLAQLSKRLSSGLNASTGMGGGGDGEAGRRGMSRNASWSSASSGAGTRRYTREELEQGPVLKKSRTSVGSAGGDQTVVWDEGDLSQQDSNLIGFDDSRARSSKARIRENAQSEDMQINVEAEMDFLHKMMWTNTPESQASSQASQVSDSEEDEEEDEEAKEEAEKDGRGAAMMTVEQAAGRSMAMNHLDSSSQSVDDSAGSRDTSASGSVRKGGGRTRRTLTRRRGSQSTVGSAAEGEEAGGGGKPRVFMLSSFAAKQKDTFRNELSRLGGTVIRSEEFERECTHVVAATPGRSEKFLCAIVSGKWLLKESYILACIQAGRFVDEQPHMWTETDAKDYPQHEMVLQSIGYWRERIGEQLQDEARVREERVGSFADMVAVTLSMEHKRSVFVRLLRAGGCSVISDKLPFESLETVTHGFIDLRYLTTKRMVGTLKRIVKENPHIKWRIQEYVSVYLRTSESKEDMVITVERLEELAETVGGVGKKRGKGSTETKPEK